MTDKELHKLSRRDLLQLLLSQGRETEELRRQLEEREEELRSLTENYERLKKRLDHKDEQIHALRGTLESERENRRIELEEAGSIAEAALKLNGIFNTAQKAAEQYLYNIKLLHNKRLAEATPEMREWIRVIESIRKPEYKKQRSAYEQKGDNSSDSRADRSRTAEGKSQT